MAGGLGVLETPSYVCAGVFLFFLVISLLLDKAIHYAQHKMSQWKRKGLKVAFDHIILEVMMLGFISLALIVFEDNITKICVPSHTEHNDWVMIYHVMECHPCLKHTKSVSQQYKDEFQCPFWSKPGKYDDHGSSEKSEAYAKDNISHSDEKDAGDHAADELKGLRRSLLAGASGDDNHCKDGQEPLVSISVLHQIHLFIFLLGVTHVVTSVITITLSSLKMRICCDRDSNNDAHMELVTRHVQSKVHLKSGSSKYGRTFSSRVSELQNAQEDQKKDQKWSLANWTAPDRDMQKLGNVLIETIIAFFKQFIRPVSVEEFHIMRASFMLTHKRATNFDFHDYIIGGLDDDFKEVVTINLLRGLTVSMFILVLPPIDWTSWEATSVMLFFLILPFAVTAKLVYIVRRVTRGGRVRQLDPSVFWFGKPRLLLPVINFMHFTGSLIFAALIFFTWEFGEVSCIFYGRSKSADLSSADWTWVIILGVAFITFVHLSIVTLPTYSLVVHMGDNHWHKGLLPEGVQASVLRLAKRAKERAKEDTARKSTDTASVNGSSLEIQGSSSVAIPEEST